MICPVCSGKNIVIFQEYDGIDYFECEACGSIFADPGFLHDIESKEGGNYQSDYWKQEIIAAKKRSFGSSINRVAELLLYSRIPITALVDIGTGPGYLLDSLSLLMPKYRHIFYGVELFPPPQEFRSTHENYIQGGLEKLPVKSSAGVCIEVIEHLTPSMLRGMLENLSSVSEEGSLYYFSSAQPEFVKNKNIHYLDPLGRGHIISYSLKGLSNIFKDHGFKVIPLPGRSWAFLVEYDLKSDIPDAGKLANRIWTALPENLEILQDNGFGPLMYTIGIESSRCYLYQAISEDRTKWALSLKKKYSSEDK